MHAPPPPRLGQSATRILAACALAATAETARWLDRHVGRSPRNGGPEDRLAEVAGRPAPAATSEQPYGDGSAAARAVAAIARATPQ